MKKNVLSSFINLMSHGKMPFNIQTAQNLRSLYNDIEFRIPIRIDQEPRNSSAFLRRTNIQFESNKSCYKNCEEDFQSIPYQSQDIFIKTLIN
jgi:hypothetical protein